MKLDSDGNVLWKKILQGDADDHGWHIALDKDSTSVLSKGLRLVTAQALVVI
jgi:hypothetical protein